MFKSRKVSVIIPIRYHSERLPGKIFTDICGKKSIDIMIDRISYSSYADEIIFAISQRDCKNIIDRWWADVQRIRKIKIFGYIGDHDDIMNRTVRAAMLNDANIIVMLSADCTLVCPQLIDQLIERFDDRKADYSTNAITRSYPDGFDVQVFTGRLYEEVNKIIPANHFSRKWTGWNIWHWRNHLSRTLRITNLEAPSYGYFPQLRVCLDTPEDKIVIEKIIEYGRSKDIVCINHREIIGYLLKHREVAAINSKVEATKLESEEIYGTD